jgi:hypothetical protein
MFFNNHQESNTLFLLFLEEFRISGDIERLKHPSDNTTKIYEHMIVIIIYTCEYMFFRIFAKKVLLFSIYRTEYYVFFNFIWWKYEDECFVDLLRGFSVIGCIIAGVNIERYISMLRPSMDTDMRLGEHTYQRKSIFSKRMLEGSKNCESSSRNYGLNFFDDIFEWIQLYIFTKITFIQVGDDVYSMVFHELLCIG